MTRTPMTSTAMATLVLALLAVPFPTAVAAKTGGKNCSNCAGTGGEISYPFGIGPECSLPGFNLTCAFDKNNQSSLLLGNTSVQMEVGVLFRSNYPYATNTILANIRYFVELIPGLHDYSVHWKAPGRPFFISESSNMSLFIVGCGIKASLFVGDSGVEVGDCSVACVEDQIMDSLPPGLCVGIGCCRIDITVNLRAFTLNISRTSKHARLLEQVSVFITDHDEHMFKTWDLGVDLTGWHAAAELSWAIPYQPNCKRAMNDRGNYACVSAYSKCLDSPMGGYVCNCTEGFTGNPYILHGCVREDNQRANYDTMQPKANCPISCGNLTVPFPFGTEVGCFAKLPLYLACNPGPSRPLLEMPDGSVVTEISIDEGTLNVVRPSERSIFLGDMDPTLYAFSGEWGVVRWAVDNMTCKDAMASKKGYRCLSRSECVDVTGSNKLITIGYRCKCSPGFEGNPYIENGCTDINECEHPDRYICNGVCDNTFGSYTCTGCPRGTDFSYITRKCKTSTVILGVTIGLGSGGGILFLAAVGVFLTRKWKRTARKQLRKMYFRKNKGILLEQLISSDQNASDGTKIFSLDELDKATNNFDHSRVVGRGGHGTVYKGILTDQRVVAIKKSQLQSSNEIEQFINEVSILSQINHRNVVKLHGCCLEAEVPLLVYEFVSNGTLYDLLHCKQSNGALFPLPWEERLRIAGEVAGALTYLHSAASVSILHRDVKCMNVLLNDSYTAKVSDFGASRSIPIDQTHLVTAVQGTFGYLDPEYYYTGQLNDKSDVYSFGVILLELLARKKPIFENENGEKMNLSNYFLWAVGEKPLEEVVDAQILGEASEEAIAGMARLAEECLSLTRGERPTMKDVEVRLQMMRGRHAVAPRPEARRGERAMAPRGGGVPIPAGYNGSRQYSLELEFVSSSRVPR
ncbi:hypothetical protein QOZ80_4AG0310060 [Eleusine coracana subsp. coracana]|nr:hypothetical protein QOZ80_4AG0310060 [Eleusine coracana subsp. coracana]